MEQSASEALKSTHQEAYCKSRMGKLRGALTWPLLTAAWDVIQGEVQKATVAALFDATA